ncbi:hypothetical protein JMJ77_0010948 [Colletotrichum scovillei]|uniref:Uncharacterized protein n=1 Tax=Colletotrichum scovillei TaxID=1209932 RepID=A0A9P7R2U1_9PEZI|nr:hypothetical protein JMJ77_0010948 [Colletotrichum scovillei]KAG7059911.1 hypothetical protein JMJ78_0015197 [Colletotrichum scovillei]KAG7067365.1 hypothetical protein JMJ76_0008804 [Colletotrichum scovillei]
MRQEEDRAGPSVALSSICQGCQTSLADWLCPSTDKAVGFRDVSSGNVPVYDEADSTSHRRPTDWEKRQAGSSAIE